MIPNWFGMVLIVLFVGAIVAGFGLWTFQMYLVARHFMYIRKASANWTEFYSRFRVENKSNVRSILSADGIRNLDLAVRLNKLGLYLFIFLMIVFALGMMLGGWSGKPPEFP